MEAMIIPLVAITIPIIIAPVAIVSKLMQKKRELEHMERMRALELGRVLPQDQPWFNPTRVIALIAGFVPLVSLAIAGIMTSEIGYHDEVWMTCGGVGISSVVCGTYLAGKYLFRSQTGEDPNVKGHFDPDAYDVVGRRG
jgi:hypothetical protein